MYCYRSVNKDCYNSECCYYTVDTFVGGLKKSAELGSTPGSSFFHEPIRHLLVTRAAAGTFGANVVDDVSETTDVAEVSLKTSAK